MLDILYYYIYGSNKINISQESPQMQPKMQFHITSHLELCERCHCQSCFHQYLDKTDREKPKSHDANRKGVNEQKRINKATMLSRNVQSSDNWFGDMVKFRKNYFWDCHADRTKL